MDLDPSSDYPLGRRRPDLVTTPSGLPLEEVTLEALRAGRLSAGDMRATPETLSRQSAIARAAGRPQLADNLARAAELATVPPETLLAIYTALRPQRSTAAELEEWADRLEGRYGAPLSAAFVREARAVYAERGLLARPPGGASTPPPRVEHTAPGRTVVPPESAESVPASTGERAQRTAL